MEIKRLLHPEIWSPDEIKALVNEFGSIRQFCIASGLRERSVGEWINNKRQPTITSRWALDGIKSKMQEHKK